jgi:hypothetical protein
MRLRVPAYALTLAANVLLVTAPAAATKPARACIAAHAAGQIERDSGRLLAAQESFASCAAEWCPAMIRRECVALGAAVQASTPNVVLMAQDEQGHQVKGAHATIDGARNVPLLDGQPLEVDPGPHRFELVLADGRRQIQNLTVQAGERDRAIVARFQSRPQADAEPGRRRNPLAYVFGGVGLAALGTWAAFAIDGRNKENDLDRCAPHCQRGDVDSMRRSYLIADVLLGVSLASFGTGTYLFLHRTDEPTTRGNTSTLWVGARASF